MSQTGGRDSGGDFSVSFGCDSCFSSETQSLCVAESKYVPNMVAIMRIFREKWLRSSIGRSQGVRSPASLSEWGGEPVYTPPLPPTVKVRKINFRWIYIEIDVNHPIFTKGAVHSLRNTICGAYTPTPPPPCNLIMYWKTTSPPHCNKWHQNA